METECPLRRALRLARDNRWVADWLFSTSPPHPAVSPEAFASALAINMSSHMTGAALLSPTVPGREEDVVFSKELDLLLVPVASMGRVVTGFAFVRGWHYCQMMASTGKKGGFYGGRFAFERASREFLMVAPGLFGGSTAILHLGFKDDINRERNLFAVPMLEYSADSLPEAALMVMSNQETRDQTVSSSFQFAHVPEVWEDASDEKRLDELAMEARMTAMSTMEARMTAMSTYSTMFGQHDDDTDSIVSAILRDNSEVRTRPQKSMEMAPVNSKSSWSFSWGGETPDGVGVPRTPGSAPTSSGAFAMGSLIASLSNIERSIKGAFFSDVAKKDIIDPVDCRILTRQIAKQYALVGAMDNDVALKFREIAAQNYYAEFLSPTTDGPLAASLSRAMNTKLQTPPATEEEGPFTFTIAEGGITSTVSSAVPHSRQGRRGTSRSSGVRATTAVPDEDRAEAKKIRNRLSAARSNERKRLELESKKNELVALHQRVEDLQIKKTIVEEENKTLKQQLRLDTFSI